MAYADDNIIDMGEYSIEDRLLLINVERIPEVLVILAEDKITCFDTNLRINQDFIYFIRRHHCDILKIQNIRIEKLPRYFNWKVVMDDDREQLILEFPWEELARAYILHDESNPLREAVENGDIVGDSI